MSIAKGRSDREAERDVFTAGFYDLIEAAEKAKDCFETSIKARLYDIISDPGLPREEAETQSQPYIDELSEQEERDIRIRKSMLIGIYSFLETSLGALCLQKPNRKDKESCLSSYIRAIYGKAKPLPQLRLLNGAIRPLRNQMNHGGSISKQDADRIKKLAEQHPEFCIKENSNDFYIGSYSGVRQLLDYVKDALSQVEKHIHTTTK